jgi:UDP-N-acetylglucosamine 4,6-dehydratase
MEYLSGKSILITGGTGSFGQACAKYLLQSTPVEKVIIFSRDEWKQWQMQQDDPIFSHPKIRFFLGDIRDLARLKLAFRDVHAVIHAAALKQVPAAEYNPTEFVNTNVIGAMNITTAAIDCHVEQVLCLSTDKAVNPLNLYGATKLCSDKLCIAANSYVGKSDFPKFSIVRYGNVLKSRGSLLPLWESLLNQGATALPITDMEMTRFWISLEESIQFVLSAFDRQGGGEIFIPKSPSVKIPDLARALYPTIDLEVVGVRPGEKIHETLISKDDARTTYEFDDHYRIIPAFTYHKKENLLRSLEGSKGLVSPDFSLSSNNNPQLISSMEEIKRLVC